jgi:hypothetical protein
MPRAFISHASEDATTARAVADALKARAIEVWIAPDSILPGQVYNEAIVAGLRGCDALCVLISARANASKHVAREVALADNNGKPIVPIRIEPVEPSDGLAYYLHLPQWVEWHARGAAALDPVVAMLGPAPPAPPAPQPPRDEAAAHVEIRRNSALSAMTRNVAILVDGQKAGEVANAATLRLTLAPGRRTLVARMDYIKSAPCEFHAEPGGAYAFELALPNSTDVGRQAAGLIGQASYFTWKRLD